jgi:glycerol kinase
LFEETVFLRLAETRENSMSAWETHLRDYIGAVDQGTTSSRFIIFDRTGRIVSSAQKEHDQIFPRPGWVEHDPNEILRRVEEVVSLAMQAKDVRPSDLAAIGITNQRETTVLWSKSTGKPVYNVIVWQDARVAETVAGFAAQGGQDRYRAKTGLPLSTYFSGLKIRWILNQVPAMRQAADSGDLLFGNTDSSLIWDPQKERFVGDAAADALLSRPQRASYTLVQA